MPNTALNRTTAALLTNESGGDVNYGDVVILDNTNDNSFTTTTISGLSTRGIGVVLEPNGIADGAQGMVAVGGWCPQVNLNAAATMGQFIKTHTVAGEGTPHSSPQVEGDFGVALTASATPPCFLFGSPNPPQSAAGAVENGVVNGRLTTESGVPVSTSDRTAQSTIYWTPLNGNRISLYNGAAWVIVSFSELSLALSGLTSGKNYDVFIDYNAGTPQIVLGSAWTNDTTRADALATQDGVYVKGGGDTDHRFVGTIRTTGTTTTEDSMAKRFVWNLYNQVRRLLKAADETADNWTYSTDTWRQANANAANQFEYVVGDAAAFIEANVRAWASASGDRNVYSGIGLDSTTVSSAMNGNGGVAGVSNYTQLSPNYYGYPGLGYHFITWLERSAAAATTTWYGDGGAATPRQSGITGTIWN